MVLVLMMLVMKKKLASPTTIHFISGSRRTCQRMRSRASAAVRLGAAGDSVSNELMLAATCVQALYGGSAPPGFFELAYRDKP